MAFNLNKNETTDPSKKFDLSKTDSPTTVAPQQQENKSKTWVLALLGLLVIGLGAWFFLSESDSGSANENAASATTSANPASSNVASGIQNDVAATTTDTVKQVTTGNAIASNTAAKTSGNTAPDPGKSNNNLDRNTATGFNNSVPATFAKGSTSISNLDQGLVKELTLFLEKNTGSIINVNGYASSEGALSVNQKISQSRANAFKRYLVSKGISTKRIKATGKGVDDPISSNNTEEGRIKNRRVEISLQ